ncbi:response regulator receiver domain-containing protein [Mesonia algae]|uniref:Response regulator receiver domain-containing protein n=1 Tax=Mesonia algae TaxID=213248 RepID=A0A2W7IFL9_9FLAO|nr:response regulator [Mesonia algae]PZW43915.1 response regulator receiver domain-containing protein [Mesonia algae]
MKICIIDDDKIYQFLLKKMVNMVDKQIITSSYFNGLDAISSFEKLDSCYDIILLDLNMPTMDGWEFIEEYQKLKRSSKPLPKIYIATSSISGEDRMRALSYKTIIKGYLIKPITLQMIKKIVE